MTFRFNAARATALTTLALLAACGGKTVDIGGESASQSLTPSAVTVASASCPTGYEHSNVCCTGGSATSAPTCASWPNEPFHPCDSGWTTYPNAASCCALDNPSDCLDCTVTSPAGNSGYNPNGPSTPPIAPSSACDAPIATPDAPQGAPTGDVSSCESRCPPGYTGVSPYDSGGCCQYQADGSKLCFAEANATSSRGSGGADDAGVGPILLADGGEYDAGGAPVDAGIDPGFNGGGPSICAFACPDGWFVADPNEGVCCNNTSNGEECFAAVFPDDNGISGDGANGSTSAVPPTVDAGAAPTH